MIQSLRPVNALNPKQRLDISQVSIKMTTSSMLQNPTEN